MGVDVHTPKVCVKPITEGPAVVVASRRYKGLAAVAVG